LFVTHSRRLLVPPGWCRLPVCTLHRTRPNTHPVRTKHASGRRHRSIGTMQGEAKFPQKEKKRGSLPYPSSHCSIEHQQSMAVSRSITEGQEDIGNIISSYY